MPTTSDVRPSPIAGTWYPGDPAHLSAQVDEFIAQAAQPALSGDLIALVAPHAGYLYAGRTAGHAYRPLLNAQANLVVVVAPFHTHHYQPYLTSAHQAYATPLGQVGIAQEPLQTLDTSLRHETGLGFTPLANDPEHALEIQLPFVQRALKRQFQLLPIMLTTHNPQELHPLGIALAHVLRSHPAILVASTDLSHFHPLDLAKQLDTEMIRRITSLDPQGVLDADRTGQGLACGAAAVAAVLWAALELGANSAKLLHYSTSADTNKDRTSVVGYAAIAITKHHD